MGIIVEFDGRSIWEPSLRIGYCFIAQVRSIEQLINIPSGISPIIADEVTVEVAPLEIFLGRCLEELEQRDNSELAALMMGCLQICIWLNWKIGGKLPRVSPKWQPILEGAGALNKRYWHIALLNSVEEGNRQS